jgi:hypothetical protein
MSFSMTRFIRFGPNLGSLSSGVAFISIGTAVSAVCNLAVIGIIARTYDISDSALFIAWWATVTIAPLGLGLVEITLARKSVNVSGEQHLRIPRNIVGEGITLASILFMIMSIGSIGLMNKQDTSSALYMISILLFSILTLIQVLQRGHALSQKKFRDSGIHLGLDGIGRLMFVLPLVFYFEIGMQSLIIASTLSSLIAIVFMKTKNQIQISFPRSIKDFALSQDLLRMSTATFGVVAVSYVVAPWFASQANSTKLATLFIASLTLSRVPMQFAGAFFSPVMVHLASLYESGEVNNAKKLEIKVLFRTGVVAIAFVPFYVLLAPYFLTLYLGFDSEISIWITFGQALVASMILISAVLQASLVAQNKWSSIASAWLPAILIMFVFLALPFDAVLIAIIGPMVSMMFVVLKMLFAVRSAGVT